MTLKAAGASNYHKTARLLKLEKHIELVNCPDENSNSQCMIWNGPTNINGDPRDSNRGRKVDIRKYLWMLSRPEPLWPQTYQDYYESVFYGFLECFYKSKGGLKALEIETPNSFPEGYEAKLLYERGDLIVPCCGSKDCINPEHLTMLFPSERRDYDFGLDKEFLRKSSVTDEIIDKLNELNKFIPEGGKLGVKEIVKSLKVSYPTAYKYLNEYDRIKKASREVAERGILDLDYFILGVDGIIGLSNFNPMFSEEVSRDPKYALKLKGWLKVVREENLATLGKIALSTIMAGTGRLPEQSNFITSKAKPNERLNQKAKGFLNRLLLSEGVLSKLLANANLIVDQTEIIKSLTTRVESLEKYKKETIIKQSESIQSSVPSNPPKKVKRKNKISNRPGGCLEEDKDYIDIQLGDGGAKYRGWLKTTWPRDYFKMEGVIQTEDYWSTFPPAAFPDYGQIHEFSFDPEQKLPDGDIFGGRSWDWLEADEDTIAMEKAQSISPEYHSMVISYALTTDVGCEEELRVIKELGDTRCMRVVAYYSEDKIVVNTLIHSNENGGKVGTRDLLYLGGRYNICE